MKKTSRLHQRITTPRTRPHHEMTTPPASTSSNMAVVESSKKTQADQVMGSAMPHHERIGKDHGVKTDHGCTRAGRALSNEVCVCVRACVRVCVCLAYIGVVGV